MTKTKTTEKSVRIDHHYDCTCQHGVQRCEYEKRGGVFKLVSRVVWCQDCGDEVSE